MQLIDVLSVLDDLGFSGLQVNPDFLPENLQGKQTKIVNKF
jgi:hypothetical protein